MVAVSYLAAVTTRVRLGFGVLVLPQRQPVLLAKQLSSLDVLSHGRLSVGIGVGYVEPELHALGVPMAERGARTDEYLAAMKTLWTQPDPSFEGRFCVLQRDPAAAVADPAAPSADHRRRQVPDAALRRAATAANGWYGVYLKVPLQETAHNPDPTGQDHRRVGPPGRAR